MRWAHVYLAGALTLVASLYALLAGLLWVRRSRPWWRARAEAEQRRWWAKYGRVA